MDAVSEIDLTEVRCPNCSKLVNKEEDRLREPHQYQCGNQLCGYRFAIDPKSNGRRHKRINTHCVWYVSGGTCDVPLTNGDIAFCPKHREIANNKYRDDVYRSEYRRSR